MTHLTQWGRLFLREGTAFQEAYDKLRRERLNDVQRILIIRQIEELYTFSGMINRTQMRDIGEFRPESSRLC